MSIILLSDPRVAAVPVAENGEPLVDIRADGALRCDDRRTDPAGAFARLRSGVADRILHAQELLPDGLRLLIVEGFRPPALQNRYYEEYAAELRTAHPDWTGAELRAQAARYVAPPEIAPHSAGAAVDLTLVDAEGIELDMGTPVNATPEESAGACYTLADGLSRRARLHRTTLSDALTAAGLVNYGTEWWHWSFGDRYWALMTGRPTAPYGPAHLHGVDRAG
ncbi:M15 family metallopeptidase [Streptomyces virginiae]|uniref:M15 family metallopeptidase n=1 Tax=Streptomyces virginiae TaxID=1961 RepID=UPI0022532688|nr:M15 family metallopeptidase [Streptomyces virginiae]MCX4961304.1 M15 family metallopeptidase [Streptomyces virginiae]MCX5180751.1 M15 family metallopeptidase [Streptomyces virginiae]